MNMIKYRANEAFYLCAVWAISFSGGLASFYYLSSSTLGLIVSLLIYGMLVVAFLGFASRKRLNDHVYSFSRTNPVIVADILIESIKLTLFSIILDAGAKGVTLDAIFDGSLLNKSGPGSWDLTRFCILVGLMLFIFFTCFTYIYPTQGRLERDMNLEQRS